MKKGFTLVELSIVLVIIGLLIGGILVGQSLVSSAKLSSQISQIQQFDAAMIVFKDKFRYLPGDSPITSSFGDGDGRVDCGATCSPGSVDHVAAIGRELLQYWHDIAPSQYAAPAVGSASLGFLTSGGNDRNPVAKMGKSGSVLMVAAKSRSYGNALADIVNPENYYAILGGNQQDTVGSSYYFATTSSDTAAVTPSDALALDSKADDGIANTGDVISGSIGDYYNPNIGGINETAASGCSSGADYLVTNDREQCTPIIRLGSQVGVVQ